MSIESEYNRVKEELRTVTIQRAQREVEDPDLYLKPDALQRELAWTLAELRRQFADLRAKYLSERAELIFIGCLASEHKYCKSAIDGLRCACQCHKAVKGARK